MTGITTKDINDAFAAATPKIRERLLYHQSVLRAGFWIAVAKGQAEAEAFVKQEMEEYDKTDGP